MTGPGLNAWGQLTLAEARMVVRDPAGLIIPIGLPLLILVMNGLGSSGEAIPELGGLSALDAYTVPMTLVMVVAVIGIINMPSFLVAYRSTGVLRRLSATPVHPAMVLVAQVLVSIVQTVLGVVLALLVARVMFAISAPLAPLTAVGVFALASAAMYALGLLLAAVAPTTNAAIAIGLVTFLATMAVGGGFGPRENLPDWLADLGEVLPFGAGLEALSAAWTGQTPDTLHIVALVVTTLISSLTAAKLFRWG